ncbi:programmed cell death 1 ligand 1 isoform X3 [Danio rerio]|uniref:Programmed cell death 1 ligand 1 n=1 Tax=Danio rerio TaxID=7955 RepID=A0A8M3AL67_DANRE|nr:programmed cell death 1 ligand 1 [Danio rerio]
MCSIHQGSMKRTLVIIFQALLWPAVLSASFTVNVPRSTYEAELNGDVRLECVFSALKRSSDITVIWSRVHPKPDVNIYWLDKGKEIHNHTSSAFHKRAQLISHLLRENRAVLHLKKLRIKDSGTYQCIVEGDEVDYKQITLNVTAPFSPVRKSLRKAGEDEVELSCESQGFPSAQVYWSDGQKLNLTLFSNTSVSSTDEDLILIVSKLKVERELVNNYTCTFIVKGEIQQTATFSIPEEIPLHGSALFVWIGAVIVVLLAVIFISIILHRRKYGQKNRRNEASKCAYLFPQSSSVNTDSLLTVNENRTHAREKSSTEKTASLRDSLTQQYSQLYTESEMKRKLRSYELHSRDGHCVNISSVIPEKGQILLLLGDSGCGKTTFTQILSYSWASRSQTDPFNTRRLRLLLLLHCSQNKGNLNQIINSSVQHERPVDVKQSLKGPEDCLLILDDYQEGNKDLEEFLKDHQTCRVLITSRPGVCPNLEKTVRTVLHLIHKPEESST